MKRQSEKHFKTAVSNMSRKSSPNIIERFTGANGRARLTDALKNQELLGGNTFAVTDLVRCAMLQNIPAQTEFIKQDAHDDDIYFILRGAVAVIINGRKVATRTAGQHVGEMALIDTTAVRSATVQTTERSVVAKVSERNFTRIANKHPELWRKLAVVIAHRLRERSRFHVAPRSIPAVFIGSSSEGLKIAQSIHKYLSRLPVVPRIWSKGIFECSKTTVESLMVLTREIDFAVLVLTPDDVTRSRGKANHSPRDNVIFEMGLFMGAVARERTYIVVQKGGGIKIPTDLLGITSLQFQRHRGRSIARDLLPVSKELRGLIEKRGPL